MLLPWHRLFGASISGAPVCAILSQRIVATEVIVPFPALLSPYILGAAVDELKIFEPFVVVGGAALGVLGWGAKLD